ncbi:hypothetical protein Goarm_016827, partial [Gossypium armourianum]|nr:hypothetical protein [Gossypium armourianum]
MYIIELDGLEIVLHVKCMGDTRWKPPDNPFVRINFDAAYKTTNKMSCSGLVIRGANERILGSITILDETIPLVFAAEALTCVQGLQIRLDLGFCNTPKITT